MQPNHSRLLIVSLLMVMLQACATTPATQTFIRDTDDLAVVVDDALAMTDRYGKGRVLVVFDIDNTLLAMEQDLGSDQWYEWQKELQNEDPCSGMLVSNRLAVQGALYFASAMRPTQPDAAALLRKLQDEGLTVIALTSRGSDFRLQTFRELRRADMTFWPSAISPARGYPEIFVPESGSRPALYEDGVFLTAGQHKGNMLRDLLTKSGHPDPSVVVFADDKLKNLEHVVETYQDSGVAIHAWRYSREDALVAAMNPAEAAAGWDALRPPLQTIQQLMGPDNFDFPQYVVPEGCQIQ